MDSGGGAGRVTLDDVYTDEMDMIGIGRILDATPHRPHSAFDLFGVSIVELDGDDSITNVATPSFISARESVKSRGPTSFFRLYVQVCHPL